MKWQRTWPWILAFGVGVLSLVAVLIFRFPEAVASEEGQLKLTHSLLLLGLLGASLAARQWFRPREFIRNACIWVALGAALLLAYSFRFDVLRLGDRIIGELMPYRGQTEAGVIRFPASRGGHFIVEADVDGTPIRFLVDTGATDVVLSPGDARRLGFDLSSLAFTRRYRTANGLVMGAPVSLRQISLGPIIMTNVRASVNQAGMSHSLLGMSFLGRLSGYEVSDQTLTLRK